MNNPMSLPMVPGNPHTLLDAYKSSGAHPLSFTLYSGYVNGVHHIITPEVTDGGKGERFHFTCFELQELDSLVRGRIESTASLVKKVTG